MIKNIPCSTCGIIFFSAFFVPSRIPKYCSKKCCHIGFRRKIVKICLHCSSNFEIVPHLNHRKFCSIKCSAESIKNRKEKAGTAFWKYASEEEKLQRYRKIFEEKVIKSDGCWGWNSFLDNGGAGKVASRENVMSSYRLSWILHNGPIPENLLVLHKCHNRACSNPSHLYLGTSKDNYNDMVNAGRRRGVCKQNSKNAKLNIEKVKEIKQLLKEGISQQKIADKFNVSRGTIQNIKENDMWRNV